MSAGHTPGPWQFADDGNGDFIITYNSAGNWLATVWHDGDDEHTEADARLIAAAPDMLEALTEIARLPHAGLANPGYSSARDLARAAIAKATGASIAQPRPEFTADADGRN